MIQDSSDLLDNGSAAKPLYTSPERGQTTPALHLVIDSMWNQITASIPFWAVSSRKASTSQH